MIQIDSFLGILLFIILLLELCVTITGVIIQILKGKEKKEDGQIEKLKREKNRLLRKLHQQILPVDDSLPTYQMKDIPNQIWSSLADLETSVSRLESAIKNLPRDKNSPEELRIPLIKILERLRDL